LAALQTRLEDMEKARQEHIEANWAGLVKVYETMKPREAAAIFNEMDMPVLLQVMDRMKDAKAAQILGAMQPDRARSITAQLAAMRTHSTVVPPDSAG
jgi:flagellar motility protein MotE (MotC chaperone)